MPAETAAAAAQVSRARTQGIIIGLVVGLIAGGITGVMLPEVSNRPVPATAGALKSPAPAVAETPVDISIKGEGASRTLVIRNTGAAALTGVKMDASNGRTRAIGTAQIGNLGPGESKELSPMKDWTWAFAPGDTFEVSADGFAPKSYTQP
jgi:hypothetical protein